MAAVLKRVAFWFAVIAIPLLLLLLAASGWVYAQAVTTNEGELNFANELAIPPILEPEVDAQGRKVFNLELQTGQTELLPGTRTETWGVNGPHLGPTIRADRGDEVLMRVANGLPESTTMHWHGVKLPAVADGGPHQDIPVGGVWEPSWTIDQPAATVWYHPHPHGRTADHVYRGVAGMFIIDDDDTGELDLPAEYGVDDIPLVVQDKRFRDDGTLADGGNFGTILGTIGDEIFVNGTYDPHVVVEDELVRFRVLNGSLGRVYDFAFDDGRPFHVVGSDSGLLESPVEKTNVQLSPGERAEIVVGFEPGDEVVLQSKGAELGMGFPMNRLNGADDVFDIIQVRAADSLRSSEALPGTLADIDPIDPGEATNTREFELGEFSTINGLEMDMDRIDAEVPNGAVEIWEISNPSGTYHNFHPHLIHFQVLDIDGAQPPPELAGWKDTIAVPPGQRVRIIARFETDPDPRHPFMFHCHILAHEDSGMMGQFTVVDDGT